MGMKWQRPCFILDGSAQWQCHAASRLLSRFDPQRCVIVGTASIAEFPTIPATKAHTCLGQEYDAVVFDASAHCHVDSLAAMVGTIRAGGVLLILLPDPEDRDSRWLQRFLTIAQRYARQSPAVVHWLSPADEMTPLSPPELYVVQQTADQHRAIQAIMKVAKGHRHRPLVLTSHRGRGKSTALGLAAAQLLQGGLQKIIVTAPSLATVDTLFSHAAKSLPAASVRPGQIQLQQACIRFVAPDRLLDETAADLVLVDEAAAIPGGMLEDWIKTFPRIVFSTTLHGYEGTGCGFAIRIFPVLSHYAPQWKQVQLDQPVRWCDQDRLEQFMFEALLLDAEPVCEITRPPDSLVDACQYRVVNKDELLADESQLRQIFGLLVMAHYRTRPSDLKMILDRPEMSLAVMQLQGQTVACLLTVEEGPIPAELARQIYAGRRRCKGHVLPQSLLSYCGVTTAGDARYQRIVRIAVHPELQRRGIGRQLLASFCKHADTDIVGCSFAAHSEIVRFWLGAGLRPVRVGLHRDTVSGEHAVLMLKSRTASGRVICDATQHGFATQWWFSLSREFRYLDPDLVCLISQTLAQTRTFNAEEQYELQAFAYDFRQLESMQYLLWQYVKHALGTPAFTQMPFLYQQLCVMKILQARDWPEIVASLALPGRKAAIETLRQAIALLLHDQSRSRRKIMTSDP